MTPSAPTTPARRQQHSISTRQALVEAAETLFAEQGYAATSLDAIVAGARVTKGALYHHFSGKQALFEAVLARVEDDAAAAVQRTIHGHDDPWEQATAGLRALLDVVGRPTYRRIVIQEGSAVLGYERFHEQQERSTFANVREIVEGVLSTADRKVDEETLVTFSRIFFGALSAAGESISTSDDPAAAGARVEAAIGFILTGLRNQMESGVAAGQTTT